MSFRTTRTPGFLGLLVVLMACVLAPAVATPPSASVLADYYARKYPSWQKHLVSSGVDEIFAGVSEADRRQAVLETLAFFHVVYHPTHTHHIENNLTVVHRYADEIDLACERFGVPPAMAYAILTWENSGREAATSYAACVGMGQMSDGAVAQAHRWSRRFARSNLAGEGLFYALANLTSTFFGDNPISRGLRARADFLADRARACDLGDVHRRLKVAMKVKDERAIPRANIEDSVVYMRYLLEMYAGRADIAISAYHNGVGNTDDLLRDYLKRVDEPAAHFTLRDRTALFVAMRRHKINFLTLWNDLRCHQMLNGIRTMDGDVTTAANQRQAMGDESDIYLWKTLGALAGTRATTQQVAVICERYRFDQDRAETVGFLAGDRLLRTRNLPATRELIGYLDQLERRLKRMAQHGKVATVPPLLVSASHDSDTHRNGLAFDVRVNSAMLDTLLRVDWLFDRVYKTRLADGTLHICLNPRYGHEFLGMYEATHRSASAVR